MSEVRGDGREEPPHVRGQGRSPRGASPRPRPGAPPEAKGGSRKEPPHARVQGLDQEQQRHAQGWGGGREGQPHLQGVVAVRGQEGLGEPSHIEGQEGWRKEIPLIQGKEQRLWFLEQP